MAMARLVVIALALAACAPKPTSAEIADRFEAVANAACACTTIECLDALDLDNALDSGDGERIAIDDPGFRRAAAVIKAVRCDVELRQRQPFDAGRSPGGAR